VATTREPADHPLVAVCRDAGLNCYRGDSSDLLDRHYQVGKLYQASAIIKIPSDCPLIDPRIIDRVIDDRFRLALAGAYGEVYRDQQDRCDRPSPPPT